MPLFLGDCSPPFAAVGTMPKKVISIPGKVPSTQNGRSPSQEEFLPQTAAVPPPPSLIDVASSTSEAPAPQSPSKDEIRAKKRAEIEMCLPLHPLSPCTHIFPYFTRPLPLHLPGPRSLTIVAGALLPRAQPPQQIRQLQHPQMTAAALRLRTSRPYSSLRLIRQRQ